MYQWLSLFILLLSLTYGDWAQEQIESDLAAFPKSSLTKEMIAKTMSELNMYAGAAHIVIQDGRAQAKQVVSTGWNGIEFRLNEVIREINAWQKKMHTRPSRLLPDSEFILSLGDGLDIDLCREYFDQNLLTVPIFVFCKRRGSDKLVLFPDNAALTKRKRLMRSVRKGNSTYVWEKKEALLFWRGGGSDGEYSLAEWANKPRARLVLLSKQRGDIDAGFTGLPQVTGHRVQHVILKQTGPLMRFVSPKEHIRYKYLMDIDGNSNGWDRCFWGLLCNSALFKQESPFSQWYYKALKPGVHYIPVKRNLEDLEEKIAWAKNHDSEVQRVAESGQKLAREIFPRAVVFEYLQRLLTEYNSRFKAESQK